MAILSNMAAKPLDTVGFWREKAGGGWATTAVLLLLFAWKLFAEFSRRRRQRQQLRPANLGGPTLDPTPLLIPTPSTGKPEIISDADLRELIQDLDAKKQEKERWEDVVDKKNGFISYNAKCCRPKDGPLKYLSVTIFEKCSTEFLRDFYMDNEYRIEWDKTLIGYKQLHVDEACGTEIGCMIKKFPLLTPREYILAWRVWEGKDKSFYCVTKDCEHPLAPRQKKYVRVGFFRSGWCIRKVPGRDACEITMVHQEDAGMNIEMAKIAFSKGIWNYVCKMNNALREYSSRFRSRSASVATMLRLLKKVPPALDIDCRTSSQALADIPTSNNAVLERQTSESAAATSERSLWKSASKKKLITNGLLLLGGIACLSRGRSTLGTQVAMACILKKLMKREPASDSAGKEAVPARISRPRREPRHKDRSWQLKL